MLRLLSWLRDFVFKNSILSLLNMSLPLSDDERHSNIVSTRLQNGRGTCDRRQRETQGRFLGKWFLDLEGFIKLYFLMKNLACGILVEIKSNYHLN